MNKLKTLLILLSLVFFANVLVSMDTVPTIDILIKKINDIKRIKVNDAIYLHTDKPYYIAGEHLWFKVYLRKSSSLLPDQWSKNVKVELLNPDGEILENRDIYAIGKHSNGDFKLRTDLPEGRYRLRAYTNWMRNFGDSTFFTQEIHIYQINPDSLRTEEVVLEEGTSNNKVLNRTQKLDLQFFPEGGKLINDVASKVGVKLVNKSGFGEEFSASIFSKEGKEITTVKSNTLGMGSFFLMGVLNGEYYAILDRDKNTNNPKQYKLPKVNEVGTTLFVTSNLDKVSVKIISTDTALKEGGYLIASTKGKINYMWECPPNRKIIPLSMKLKDVQDGIVKLTLLNKDLQPIVERVIFNYHPQEVDLNLAKTDYRKREKVDIDINVKDENGVPIKGEASLAIVDKSLVDISQKKNNIISELILSSEIHGFIENPMWYFQDYSKEKHFYLDELMLTQGYRKIEWLSKATDSLKVDFIPEPGISIKGKTSNYWNEKKAQQSEISMTALGSKFVHESVITDELGGFTFTGMVFFDTTDFIFQAKKYKAKKSKVTKNSSINISLFAIEPPLAESIQEERVAVPSNNSLAAFEEEMLKIEKIDRAFNTKTIILDEIEIVDTAEPDEFDRASKMYTNYTARLVTDSLSYAGGYNVWEFLQMEMKTAQVLRRAGLMNASASIDDDGNILEADQVPVVLDGFPADVEMLRTMSMTDIGFIDVLDAASGSMYLSNSVNGVIALYTRQGGGGSYIVQGIDAITSPGFYTSKEFYTPKYDVQKDEHAKPDHRITLMWEPNIFLDENGQARVSFFTDDKSTNYHIEIEGISNKGKPFYQEKEFETK
ncbi:hypothetical protein EI427_23035 [Flammeovirga pectinis]|uniref:TonB-dependent receptor plug domain-containing protein n=1 Tax=Flammeovirga pectinis TaxID=2494373 RepID=A0A3S9PA74_9BACT|nr:Plug domain-containing protein [Flammeovirga pectinis]AZQ65094.1 hypothetical protein EI427_23035 [Flammeovirga pectinis]